jgi:hypothetical protein
MAPASHRTRQRNACAAGARLRLVHVIRSIELALTQALPVVSGCRREPFS